MRKIEQGKYELFTTTEDAIDKFMQMQGICREEFSDKDTIAFICTKKGKIFITDPPRRHVEYRHSTKLFAQVIQQKSKTYVTYHTAFNKSHNIFKSIDIIIDLLICILTTVFAIAIEAKTYYLTILLSCVLIIGHRLIIIFTKEKTNSTVDSDILIKELEKRVEAVNLWDK